MKAKALRFALPSALCRASPRRQGSPLAPRWQFYRLGDEQTHRRRLFNADCRRIAKKVVYLIGDIFYFQRLRGRFCPRLSSGRVPLTGHVAA